MMAMKKNDEMQPKTTALGVEAIPRLVLRFAATTLAALLLNAVYTLTDALFISWGVGENAMGGVSVVFPFVILQGAISTALGGGAASIISRKLGEGKKQEAGEVTLNAMLAFYSSAILITILGLALLNPLLEGMGVTGELLPYAKQYFTILLAGNVFSTGFSSIIRAEGKMLYGLLIWVIPISINIVLDAVFILVLGWGVQGSALATVICQFTSFCMCVLFFLRFTTQSFKGAKCSGRRMREILAIGLPSLIQIGSLSIISVLLNNLLRETGGTLGVNTYAYLSKIITFAVMPFTAVTQALSPIVGYNYGAGKLERVKKTVRFCAMLSLGYALAALTLIEAFPHAFLRVFTISPEILSLGIGSLRILAAALLFMPLPMLSGAAFQAVGQKGWAFVMYASNLIFLIPAAFCMASRFGINGIWWAYVVANIGASLLALFKMRMVKAPPIPKG